MPQVVDAEIRDPCPLAGGDEAIANLLDTGAIPAAEGPGRVRAVAGPELHGAKALIGTDAGFGLLACMCLK